MYHIERIRHSWENAARRLQFRNLMRGYLESKFWDTQERISTVYNPEVMAVIERLRLNSLVVAEVGLSDKFALRLWQHQFELSENQARESHKYLRQVSDSSDVNDRFEAAEAAYTILSTSRQTHVDFNPTESARILMSFERSRSSEDPFGRKGAITTYISRVFANIYGIDKYDLRAPAQKYEEAHRLVLELWKISGNNQHYEEIWNNIQNNLWGYYEGLHDLVAYNRGLKSWGQLAEKIN